MSEQKLKLILTEALYALERDPHGRLAVGYRNAVWQALGPTGDGFMPRGPGRIRYWFGFRHLYPPKAAVHDVLRAVAGEVGTDALEEALPGIEEGWDENRVVRPRQWRCISRPALGETMYRLDDDVIRQRTGYGWRRRTLLPIEVARRVLPLAAVAGPDRAITLMSIRLAEMAWALQVRGELCQLFKNLFNELTESIYHDSCADGDSSWMVREAARQTLGILAGYPGGTWCSPDVDIYDEEPGISPPPRTQRRPAPGGGRTRLGPMTRSGGHSGPGGWTRLFPGSAQPARRHRRGGRVRSVGGCVAWYLGVWGGSAWHA